MRKTAVKRVGLTVAVALLVTLAGCSSLGIGGDGGDGSAGDADGYGVAGGDLDGTTLADATAEAVESGGSYTVEQSSSVTGTQQGTEFTTEAEATTRVDLEGGQGLRESQQTRSTGDRSQETSSVVYTDGDTSYRQQTAGGNVSYDSQEGEPDGLGGIRPVNVTAFDQNYAPIVDALAWEQDGSDEIDGVAVTTYAATGVENESELGIGQGTTIADVGGSMLVDSDGVVRQISLQYSVESDGSTTELDATITLSDVGSTTVEEPDWLSEAQSS